MARSNMYALLVMAVACLMPCVLEAVEPFEDDAIYHEYPDIVEYLNGLSSKNPSVAFIKTLPPKTVGGGNGIPQDIYALKISSNVQPSDDPSKPDVLILAGLHAREWLAVEAARMTAKYLVWSYTSCGGPPEERAPDCEQVRFLLDHTEVWIVPVGNPDGNIWSHSDQEIAERRMWRKNRWKDTVGTVYGVDINRNFDEPNWGGTGNAEGWGRWGRN